MLSKAGGLVAALGASGDGESLGRGFACRVEDLADAGDATPTGFSVKTCLPASSIIIGRNRGWLG